MLKTSESQLWFRLVAMFHFSDTLPFLSQASSSVDDSMGKPTAEDLMEVLEVVRLGDILSRFNGLDSMYEWSSVLSLGEQQRLALPVCYFQSQGWFYWMSPLVH